MQIPFLKSEEHKLVVSAKFEIIFYASLSDLRTLYKTLLVEFDRCFRLSIFHCNKIILPKATDSKSNSSRSIML